MHPDNGCPMDSMLSGSFIVESNDNKYGIIGLAPTNLASEIKRPEEIESCHLSDFEDTLKDLKKEVEVGEGLICIQKAVMKKLSC